MQLTQKVIIRYQQKHQQAQYKKLIYHRQGINNTNNKERYRSAHNGADSKSDGGLSAPTRVAIPPSPPNLFIKEYN